MNLQLFLFGAPRIESGGAVVEVDRRKALALIAYLALAEQPQSRDILATLLWPDLDQDHARAALRRTLPALTALAPDSDGLLAADRAIITLNREVIEVDVSAFLTLLAQVRAHDHETLCEDCLHALEQAAGLYREDFMAGFALPECSEYEDWTFMQREWLRLEFAGALKRLVQHYTQQTEYERGLQYARRWVELDPLHEPAQRALMHLYAASGNRSDALRQYQACVRLLDEELATPPENETSQLYEAIKNSGESAFQAGSGVASGVLPPLPSLIIGRENSLHDLKMRFGVEDKDTLRPVTVIQGWPGVGKSTTVAALAHDPQVAHMFPDGVLWGVLGESPELLATLITWADALNVSQPGRTPKLEELSAQITAALRNKRVLLILDDVWQTDHATPFKVGGQHCAMVMTTRLNEVAQALAPTSQDIYRLPVLSEDKALELLQTLTPETVQQYPRQSRTLVRDLEGLPLAIQVAGRLLHSEARLGWGVSELLEELREGAKLLEAQVPADIPHRETTPTIAALLERSTAALDSETRERFADLALFVPKPATFGLSAMAVVWEVQDPKPTARILVNRGLLEPVSGGRFQIHALLVWHAKTLQGEAA
jgi:DNA-binding SARP family transcriptional activator